MQKTAENGAFLLVKSAIKRLYNGIIKDFKRFNCASKNAKVILKQLLLIFKVIFRYDKFTTIKEINIRILW